jgi:hypothetical protein
VGVISVMMIMMTMMMIIIMIIIIIIIRNKEMPLPNFILRDSVCGLQATDWTVRGSIPGKGRDFRPLSTPALWPTHPPVQ